MTIEAFWNATPREVAAVVKGVTIQREEEQKADWLRAMAITYNLMCVSMKEVKPYFKPMHMGMFPKTVLDMTKDSQNAPQIDTDRVQELLQKLRKHNEKRHEIRVRELTREEFERYGG